MDYIMLILAVPMIALGAILAGLNVVQTGAKLFHKEGLPLTDRIYNAISMLALNPRIEK